MNDCPNGDIRDLLPDLLHDRLAGPERERVEAHLRACTLCEAELGLLRDLRTTLRRAPSIDVGAIAAAIPAYHAPVRRSWTAWRAAAAIVAVAVGGTSIALVSRQSDQPRVVEVRSPSNPGQTPSGSESVTRPTQPSVAVVTSPNVPSTLGATTPAVTLASGTELAMGGAAVNDLSDRELSALLDEIESLDALPSTEVESALPVTPLPPAGEGQ
jgi:hypothetical protein